MRLSPRKSSTFRAAVAFFSLCSLGAMAAPARIILPAAAPGAAIELAANSVTGSHAIRAKPGQKFVKRRIRHGYWQECSYDGYCRYVYNGSGGYLKAR